jgi:hypothetical protein
LFSIFSNLAGQFISSFTYAAETVTMNEESSGSIRVPVSNLDPVNNTFDEKLGGLPYNRHIKVYTAKS